MAPTLPCSFSPMAKLTPCQELGSASTPPTRTSTYHGAARRQPLYSSHGAGPSLVRARAGELAPWPWLLVCFLHVRSLSHLASCPSLVRPWLDSSPSLWCGLSSASPLLGSFSMVPSSAHSSEPTSLFSGVPAGCSTKCPGEHCVMESTVDHPRRCCTPSAIHAALAPPLASSRCHRYAHAKYSAKGQGRCCPVDSTP
jgi:hypothetical protein